MATSFDEAFEFLAIVKSKGFINDNTAIARATACRKFVEILDDEQKNVEYVRDHLDVIKQRFTNLNKDMNGSTVDEYARRVRMVIEDFLAWKQDRSAWERSVAAKQANRASDDGEKKARAKADKPKVQVNGSAHAAPPPPPPNPEERLVTFPIRPDFDLKITLPRNGLTVPELKKLLYFLLPYCADWEPTESPRSVFSVLEADGGRA
jgi:hypothetical protein